MRRHPAEDCRTGLRSIDEAVAPLRQYFGKAGEAPKQPGPITRDKTELSEMNVAELRDEAARRGIDVDGLTKAEIREKLAQD